MVSTERLGLSLRLKT